MLSIIFDKSLIDQEKSALMVVKEDNWLICYIKHLMSRNFKYFFKWSKYNEVSIRKLSSGLVSWLKNIYRVDIIKSIKII